jgi:hypothetical protein
VVQVKGASTAGSLGPTDITLVLSYYGPIRNPLAFDPFPSFTGYKVYLAPTISRRGQKGFSSCLACPCHHAVATTPPKRLSHISQRVAVRNAFALGCRLGLRGFSLSRPPMRSFSLQPGDSSTIPRTVLSMSFRLSVSLQSVIQTKRLLTFTSVGLTPTGHASLR